MKKFLPIVAVSSIMLLAACGQDSNRPYDKLNDVNVADVTNNQLQSAKEVTYDQLVNGDIKKGKIIKVVGETTTINDNFNDDDWGKLSKGDQFEIDDKDSNALIARNEDNSFKNPVGKKVTIYGTYEGVDKKILSKDDKKLGLTSENVPLLIAYKVEKRTSTKPSSNSSAKKMITSAGGLGDSLDVWKNNYGSYIGDASTSASFEDDYLLAIFADNKAVNVTIQFEQSNKKYRTKSEAIEAFKDMIPSDAKKIKEEDGPEKDVIYYQSNTLAKVLDKNLFTGATPGTMMAILEKNSNNKYYAVVLGPGNNP